MTNSRTKLTIADYMATADDKRYQLLDGDLILAPSPIEKHQWISGQIYSALNVFVNSQRLGRVYCAPLDVILSENDVVQPDVLFVSNERNSVRTGRNIQGAPDLVVEILSPSTAFEDQGRKRALYQEHGVQEYWMVDPETNTVEILVASERGFTTADTYNDGDTLVSTLLRGLSIDLEPIFAD